MHTIGILGVALGLAIGSIGQAHARCGDQSGDDAAVAAARAEVNAVCDCAGAESRGSYVSCAAAVANARAGADLLPRNCKGEVKRCAARSTCGKPGFVTCCRTSASGATRCSTKSSDNSCTAPPGGAACVGTETSCCDSCTDGCGASPSGAFLVNLACPGF